MAAFRGEREWASNFYQLDPGYLIWDSTGTFVFWDVEHAFIWAKEPTKETYDKIKDLPPGKAKGVGRKLNLNPNWDKIKVEVMRRLLSQKFKDPKLKAKLLATGTEDLIEYNEWHDNFWGYCTCSSCSQRLMAGKNTLGKLLMELREKLSHG